MERKIGETFEYKGRKLKTIEKEGIDDCDGCVLFKEDCKMVHDFVGECEGKKRSDNKGVVFVNADEFDEQPEEQAEQPKLNLCEILKNCPEGTELWSDNYGIVKFVNVETEWDTPIRVELTNGSIARYTEEGWCDKRFPANCLLWPSKDCRDWSKFTAPWLKKKRFDPKTLKAFDRIIVRDDSERWLCTIFSYIGEGCYPYNTVSGNYAHCIPYNDDTKHLVGTKDEAPEFYKYWEY